MSIEVTGISKIYGTQKALNNISIKVDKPEIVGFLGPNGAGKSTMMKILTTYIEPSSGTAKVNGFDIASQQKQVQQSVGYLPEHNPLYLEMYVKEYLHFNANVYGVNKARVEEVVELTNYAVCSPRDQLRGRPRLCDGVENDVRNELAASLNARLNDFVLRCRSRLQGNVLRSGVCIELQQIAGAIFVFGSGGSHAVMEHG